MESKNIIFKYIITFALIFGIIMIIRVYFDVKHHEDMLNEKVNDLTADIELSFRSSEQNLIDKYYMLTRHLMNSENIYDCFINDKREELFERLKRDYEEFKSQDSNLHVMHFIDPKNVTVLRMHKPGSFDDDLTKKRPIVAYANNSLKKQTAFEVGKNGIVYRVTTPFIHKSTHAGVLEFGIKPEHFVDNLKKKFDIEAEVLVKTESLKTLIAKRKYPTLGEFSIVSYSDVFERIFDKIDLSKPKQIITDGDKTYILLNSLNLKNYQDEVISKVLVLKDITLFIEKNNSSLIFINLLTILIFTLILFILYIILSKFSKEIKYHTKKADRLHKKSLILQDKANTDDLTKIFNKRYFDKYLKSFLNENKEASLIFFDIDHFKKINDTHGHIAGDKILVELAFIVKELLREDDIFVRWGGEEFIILIEDISFESAINKAHEIRKTVENSIFYNEIPVTISLGVTKTELDDTKSTLLQRADENLYKAKNSGRNCVVCD